MKHRIFPLAALLLGTAPAWADDTLTTNNGIVQSFLCVGTICTNPELYSFDDDTLRLKRANTRIHFYDTSTSPFPANDWRIVANDPFSGGENYFAIKDDETGNMPFKVMAGARDNAFFMTGAGDIGMGTQMPGRSLHIVKDSSPGVRLEQTNVSFPAQTWDMIGNSGQFAIYDATNSTMPFKIKPSAPTNALYVDEQGDVGFGTDAPVGRFTIAGNGQQIAYMHSLDDGPVQLRLRSKTQNRRIMAYDENNNLRSQILFYNSQVRLAGPTDSPSDVYLIAGPAGVVTRGPNCNATHCDAVFDPDAFDVPSIKDHAQYMWENMYLKAVGPTSEEAPFNMTQKMGGMLHELEIGHIYIEQLHDEMTDMKRLMQEQAEHNAQQAEQIERLTARLPVE